MKYMLTLLVLSITFLLFSCDTATDTPRILKKEMTVDILDTTIFYYDTLGYATEILGVRDRDTVLHNRYKNDIITDEFFIMYSDTISRTYKTLIDQLNYRLVQAINSDSVVGYRIDIEGKYSDFSISLDHNLNCLENGHSTRYNEMLAVTVTYNCDGASTQLIEEVFVEANVKEKIRYVNLSDSIEMVNIFMGNTRFSYTYDLVNKDTVFQNTTQLYREYY